MSDHAQAISRKPDFFFIAAGLASSLLFMSAILSFAFLLPVQMVFGRRGGREGLAATGVSAACTFIAMASFMAATGGFAQASNHGPSGLAILAGTFAVPTLLLLALALVNAPVAPRWSNAYRILAVSLIGALVAVGALLAADRNGAFSSFMEEQMGAGLSWLRSVAANPAGGYESSVLEAMFEPKAWLAMLMELLRNSVAALIFAMLSGSWWLGNRMSGFGSKGRERAQALDQVRMPYSFLWGFLLSWTYALAVVLLKAQGAVSEIAWNCVLVFSFAYAGTGLGIVSYLLKSWNTPKSLRICLAIMAVIAMASPYGVVVIIALSILGVTEIWIHYRKPKGVGA
jgi:hypothetical protein